MNVICVLMTVLLLTSFTTTTSVIPTEESNASQDITCDFDILQPCGYTEEQLLYALSGDSYKEMRPYVGTLLEAEEESGVNAFYLMCKLGFESGWGKHTSGKNNIGGWKGSSGSYRDFASVEDCIFHISEQLSTTYKDAVGSRLEDVCQRYCPSDRYLKTLIEIMRGRQNKMNEGILLENRLIESKQLITID